MPADDGLGSNDVNDRTPIGPAARQPHPEQAIGLAQARSFGVSLVDRQLLAKRQILKDEAPAAGQSHVEQSNEPEEEGNHCYQNARTANPAVKGVWAQAPQSKRLRTFGEAQRFASAHSSIPLTAPSHISLFTSRYPQEHGARINGFSVPKDSRWLSLPQVLKRFGYQNAAFVSAWPLTARLTHLDRWFDHYDEDLGRKYQVFNSSRYAEDVTPLAVSWLENNQARPFFLWVHYFDPHSPYNLREEFAVVESSGHPNSTRKPLSREMEERIKLYDSEIGYADFHIGKLLARVDEQGLRDSTLVVLAADHGESLGEHGYVGHGRQLTEGIVRIPLIMRYPAKVPAGKVVSSNVSLLDVTPTILEFAIGKQPERQVPMSFAGRSLACAMLDEERIPSRPIRYVTFAGKKGWMPRWISQFWVSPETTPLRIGQTFGVQKMIWNPNDKSLSVFDIEEDPFELSPVVLSRRDAQYRAKAGPLSPHFQFDFDIPTFQRSSASLLIGDRALSPELCTDSLCECGCVRSGLAVVVRW